MNEYVNSDEYIFIQYHDIIKSFKPYLLTKLLYEYRKEYDGCIDFDRYKDYSDNQLLGLSIKSTDKNVLKYLMTSPINADLCLYDLYNSFPNIFSESKLLTIGTSIFMMLKQKYVKNIYIHTDTYDERIHKDLQETFADMSRITYVTGSFVNVIQDIPEKITTYILNDVELIDTLIEYDKISYTNVLIADCGWNYKFDKDKKVVLKVDDIDSKSKKYIFKTGTFRVDKYIVY